MEPQRRIGGHRRVLRDVGLASIAAELADDQIIDAERPRRAQHLRLLVVDRLGVDAGGGLHRQVAHDLQQVILDDVPDHAHLFVQFAAPVDAEALRHRDLNVLDVMPVPDRLEERVGEAEIENVLHRLLAEIVIDAEDRILWKDLVQRLVQRARGREIPAERFLDDDARPVRASRFPELAHDDREHARRDREVVRGTLSLSQLRSGGA